MIDGATSVNSILNSGRYKNIASKFMSDIEIEAINRLKAAIGLRAVIDYRDAYQSYRHALISLSRLRTKPETEETLKDIHTQTARKVNAEADLKELEHFFKSEYGELCTGLDGDKAIKQLREQLRKEGRWTRVSIFDATVD